MSKIRVLQVSGSLAVGGLQTVAMNCFRYIDRDKYDFDYLVYGDQIGEYEDEVKRLGGRVIHIPSPKNDYVKFYRNVKKVILDYGPYDIVHSHTFFNSGIVLMAAKYCGVKKCIAHAHSGKRKGSNRPDKAIYNAVMRQLITYYADIYCACSKKAGDYLYGQKTFSSGKGAILSNAIDIDKYVYSESDRHHIRSELQIDKDERVIGTVGHLTAAKNQTFLLETFALLTKNTDGVKLLMVGDGELSGELHKLATDLSISDKVIWTGTRTDIPQLLSTMDVFALPSLHEGFGIALLEAQANGLPCVVGKGTIPEQVWISENHYEIDFSDSKSWINAFEKAKRANAANKQTEFSISAFTNAINGMYQCSGGVDG